MKHSIRQRVLDPVTGLKVTKLEQVNGELGSGLYDRNGKEIFEGDKITVLFASPDGDDDYTDTVRFKDGVFILEDTDEPLKNFAPSVEVVGHVEDTK